MSSRQSTPFLIALGVVALAAVGWLLFHFSGGENDSAPDEIIPVESSDDPSTSALAAADSGEEPRPADVAERAEVPGESESAGPGFDESEAQWIRGRVELPPDTPADEQLFVLCVDRRSGPGRLYGAGALADSVWDSEVRRQGLLASASVESDGRFRIAVPASLEKAHLALSGRYLYSTTSTECALPAENRLVVLSGTLGAWITGTVSATTASPELRGKRATLGPDIGGPLDPSRIERFEFEARTSIGEDNTFEFRGVNPVLAHRLLIQHDTLATHLQAGLQPRPGEHLRLDILMRAGARLAGRVVDEAGSGVSEVEVGARPPGPIWAAIGNLRETRTDARGEFVLEHVYLGKVVVNAERRGFLSASLPLDGELVDGQEIAGLELVLEAGERLSGTVRFPGGAPAAGADLDVSADLSMLAAGMPGGGFGAGAGGTAETEADGTFLVSGLGKGPFQVTARLEEEEGERAGTWSATAKGVLGGTSELALELEQLATVSGRVTDLAGDPIPRFHVAATLQGSGGILGIGAEELQRSIDESEDGTFVLDGLLRSGSWEFEVTAPGFASSTMSDVEIPSTAPDAELLFVLEPAAGVSGTVLDSFGNPIGGASVSREITLAEGIAAQGREQESVASNPKGQFLLTGLDPGAHAIVATKEGFAESAAAPVELVSGEVTLNIVLQLRVGGLLTGEVLDDEGKPAVGRMIIVRANENPLKQRFLPSDSSGEFRVEHLAPGGYQVIAMANFMTGEVDLGDGGLNEILGDLKMEMVEIVDGEETHVVLGKPPEDPVTLVGRVVHSGEPVPNVMVSLVPEGGGGMGDMKITNADQTGTFTMELAKRGAYLVTVQDVFSPGMQNSVEFREKIPAEGERHELTLELPHGRISGRILGPDGEPAVGCRVTLGVDGGMPLGSFLGGNYADLTTDAQGNYEIPYLRPGTYTVSAGGALLGGMLGDGSAMGRVVRSGLRVSEGEWLDGVDFRLDEPGELIGHVFSLEGSPVSGAAVFVRDEAGRLMERFSMATTDSSGTFTYPGLAPGDYTFTAALGDEVSSVSEPIHVPEGGRGEARVTLEAGTTLEIRVVDKTGADVRARISVLDPDGREMSGMISLPSIMEAFSDGFASDAQKVGPLPPGKYRVTAILDDGRESYKRVNLSGSRDTRKVVLRVK